jgi:hypothetical protein
MQHIELIVPKEKIGPYTTLLQSGISLECRVGQPIGVFLCSLPGFDMEYIVDRIQTIFLDGNAIDDMETLFSNSAPVLALSAAMPGLAGAIFRKNSLHAALRTSDSKNTLVSQTDKKILVCLKLFNMIATEKGPGLLEKGGVFSGSILLNFFEQRSQLKQNITHITMAKKSMPAETFWPLLDPSLKYHVTISSHRDIH